MILFFDTETTGFVRKNIPHNDPQQARVCQLAAMLCTPEGETIQTISHIIKPDGWFIHPKVAEIHGISQERALREGKPAREVWVEFMPMVAKARLCVAHNFSFDNSMMEIESFCANDVFHWIVGQSFCTMLISTPICKIPSARGGYKWPKLMEIHKHLFGCEFEGAHDALNDIKATAKVFFELKRLGHVPNFVETPPASDISFAP